MELEACDAMRCDAMRCDAMRCDAMVVAVKSAGLIFSKSIRANPDINFYLSVDLPILLLVSE